MTRREFQQAVDHADFVPAPKAGSTAAATDGTVRKKATSGSVVEFDLSDWVGLWVALSCSGENVSWFARPAGSSVDPDPAAVVGTTDGQQCAVQVDGDPAFPFVVEAGYTEIAVLGSSSGVCTITLLDQAP